MPPPDRRVHLRRAAEVLYPPLHALQQAELAVAREAPLVIAEPHPVVADGDQELAVDRLRVDSGSRRVRVLNNVVESDGDVAAFGAELGRRFSTEHTGRGVNLLTYHRAKGLDFDAVFLPRLLDGELPFRSGRAKADPEEERRQLYVGITRARRYLFLTWPTDGRARPSPFLVEMELAPSGRSRTSTAPGPTVTVRSGGAVFDLKEWRRKRANADGVPAYVVFPRPHAGRDIHPLPCAK